MAIPSTPQDNGSHFDCSKTITAGSPEREHPQNKLEVRAAEAVDFQGAMDVPKTSGQNPGWGLGNEARRPEPTEAASRSNIGQQVGSRRDGVAEVAEIVAKAVRGLERP